MRKYASTRGPCRQPARRRASRSAFRGRVSSGERCALEGLSAVWRPDQSSAFCSAHARLCWPNLSRRPGRSARTNPVALPARHLTTGLCEVLGHPATGASSVSRRLLAYQAPAASRTTPAATAGIAKVREAPASPSLTAARGSSCGYSATPPTETGGGCQSGLVSIPALVG